jgi:hypothetical protein
MRLYWLGLLALLAFRLWFAAVLPMTGDEAYFVFWGEHPAGGYYDHPPMVGWWLSALLTISRAEWFLRLPSILLPLILAWGAWWLVRTHGAERARLAALLILLQPANVLNVLITTDTPVILFSFLSILAYVAALRSEQQSRLALLWHALAGALLGLAFLGKYFAALLGMAYLVHVLFIRRDAGRWPGFALLLFAALPAPLYNLWWNSSHCWVNILFNFMNRNAEAGFSWQNPLLYLASLVYLATPWVLFELWRQRQKVLETVRASAEASAAFWLMLVPLALFALMSFWRSIGLHWLLSFIPLLGVLAAIVLAQTVLVRLVRWSAVFGVVQVLAMAIVVTLPAQAWKDTPFNRSIALRLHAKELLMQLAPFAPDHLLAMESFSGAAFMAYQSNRPVAVFGSGSYFARQDDFETDWRAQSGRNVLILRTIPPKAEDYLPYFRQVEIREIVIGGTRFHLIIGQGFNYAVYHEKVLARIHQRFYQIPAWLPQRGCEFSERYFSE